MRFTVQKTRRAYVSPATHFASNDTNPNLPRMGERLRLRRDFDVTGFPPHARAILEGLKKYGMLVADNGGAFFLSISPDRRFQGLSSLSPVHGRDFEVVQTTQPDEGASMPDLATSRIRRDRRHQGINAPRRGRRWT